MIAPATTATTIRPNSCPRCTHSRVRYSPRSRMSPSVTTAAASNAPHRRWAEVAGMSMAPKKSHVPTTAMMSTIRSRILRPLLFRTNSCSAEVSCSACGSRRDGGIAHIDPIVGQSILKTSERRINRRGPPVRAELSHLCAPAPSQPVGLCHSIPLPRQFLGISAPEDGALPFRGSARAASGGNTFAKTSCANSPEYDFLCVV